MMTVAMMVKTERGLRHDESERNEATRIQR